jgi:type IV pilus assembly protein PilB
MPQFDDTFSEEKMDEIRRKEEEHLLSALAVQNGYEYIDLRGITINPTALFLITEDQARRGEIVPFETIRKRVSVAVRNPDKPETKAALEAFGAQGYTVTVFMSSLASLEHGWSRYHDQNNTSAVVYGVMDINSDNITQQIQKFKTPEAVAEHIEGARTLNNVRRVSETLESIFAGAIALGASDIHIEPEVAGIRLRYRLDGVLRDIMDLDVSLYQRLMSRLKLLSGMILNIRDKAQDGRFTFTTSEKEVEVRSSVIPGASGEAMVMRLLDPTK